MGPHERVGTQMVTQGDQKEGKPKFLEPQPMEAKADSSSSGGQDEDPRRFPHQTQLR